MLSADKDLLLAKLNQDLLGLHLLELNTVLNRFQNAIGASSPWSARRRYVCNGSKLSSLKPSRARTLYQLKSTRSKPSRVS